jgi:hypothetical protein
MNSFGRRAHLEAPPERIAQGDLSSIADANCVSCEVAIARAKVQHLLRTDAAQEQQYRKVVAGIGRANGFAPEGGALRLVA